MFELEVWTERNLFVALLPFNSTPGKLNAAKPDYNNTNTHNA